MLAEEEVSSIKEDNKVIMLLKITGLHI